MERRYVDRIDSNVKAVIYHGSLPIAIARVKNTSKHSLYLETEYKDVALYQKLDIELPLRMEGSLRHFRFTAHVTRIQEQGLVLAVSPKNAAAVEAMQILFSNCALLETTHAPKRAWG